jgi:hypothetical protein
MKTAIRVLGLICVLSSAATAFAAETDCRGIRYVMQAQDVISLDQDDPRVPACIVPSNRAAFLQEKDYCTDDHCDFRGHIESQQGNTYTIDVILGPITEDAPN